MKEQVSVVVQQLGMQLIDEVCRLLDPSILNCVSDEDSVLQSE